MRYLICIHLIMLSFANNLFAQNGTIITFDCKSKQVDTISPPEIPLSDEFNNTAWNYGSSNEKIGLSTDPPSETYPNSGFTDILPAQNFFDISQYPVQAIVKFFLFEKGGYRDQCSGVMVSPRLVLTCAHCTELNKEFYDTLLATPCYDNNIINTDFGSSLVRKVYILDTWYNKTYDDDIALVELEEPLGIQTGWIGIAWQADEDFEDGAVYHTFSYPYEGDDATPDKIFNGDTLYYKYGTLDFVRSDGIGYNGFGYSGESGSSLIYTDNTKYYSHGTLNSCLNGSQGYKTYYTKIQKYTFYAFKQIIESDLANYIEKISEPIFNKVTLQVYPNPAHEFIVIRFNLKIPQQISIKLYNLVGKEIAILSEGQLLAGEHQVKCQANELPGGIYFVKLQYNSSIETLNLIIQK